MTEQFVTSVLIGYVNTGAYQAVDVALNSRIPYLAAHVVAFAVSVVGSFVLNSYPTCRTRPTGAFFSAIRYPLSAVQRLPSGGLGSAPLPGRQPTRNE
ncbi:GtrA family protein [Streptomyces sp. MAA16]|uniref:GtrA family protein n=1 Tax=Streptomyces sp. MAA16 TaxID=3035116 RepID=UPI00247D2018|nr:putative flippase GtrA [Streptomyces sp. MAA16]